MLVFVVYDKLPENRAVLAADLALVALQTGTGSWLK